MFDNGFSGSRKSIVHFGHRAFDAASAHQRRLLLDLGFPIPGNELLPPAFEARVGIPWALAAFVEQAKQLEHPMQANKGARDPEKTAVFEILAWARSPWIGAAT